MNLVICAAQLDFLHVAFACCSEVGLGFSLACNGAIRKCSKVMVDTKIPSYLFSRAFEFNHGIQHFPDFGLQCGWSNQDEVVHVDSALYPEFRVVEETWRPFEGEKASLEHVLVHLFVPHRARFRVSVKGLPKNDNWVTILGASISIEPGFWP